MAKHPPGSSQLPRPHHYQSSPEEEAGADRLLEKLAHELAQEKGITLDEARKHLKHWV